MAKKAKTTTRSYTLGLLAPSDADDWKPLWDRLFRTHRAICRGAQVFGEFYLNLRGGLSAALSQPMETQHDEERTRLLLRGARRILALGWLSVEDDRGAQEHPHRVREIKPGESLSQELAQRLLRQILRDSKGITEEDELANWTKDCVQALTARIRPDAVIVNRAASFAEWQQSVGGNEANAMPKQARRILFAMCGDGFASLTLPEEEAVKQEAEQTEPDAAGDDAEDKHAEKSNGEVGDAEPSNASRGVFGDLFGGDAAEKLLRAAKKDEFARDVGAMLVGLDAPPTQEAILSFREQRGLLALDTSKPDKYPKEVSSSGAPTAVAKRYRKLLVGLGLWPKSDEEDGLPRTQASSKFSKRVAAQGEQRSAHINALDLIDVCPKPTETSADEQDAASTSGRVFTPPWASALAERVAAATNMLVNAKPLNEFKRLMFALAARRISQTQTWTKRNEVERHKAAVKEDAARQELEKLDPKKLAQVWFKSYEEKRFRASGSLAEFRVTKRMIAECDAVFKAWQGIKDRDEREKQTDAIQAKAEKFGDARLYVDLSEDPAAAIIWQHEQGAEVLKPASPVRSAAIQDSSLLSSSSLPSSNMGRIRIVEAKGVVRMESPQHTSNA